MDHQEREDDLPSRWLSLQIFDPPIMGGVMICGRPIFLIPDSKKKYGNFLAWWNEVGRLRPTDPQGWNSISGPWVRRGRVELINESDWAALPQSERDLIEQWTKTIPIGCFYD
jgi:hypothetical protein